MQLVSLRDRSQFWPDIPVISKSIKARVFFQNEASTKLIFVANRNFEKVGRNFRERFAPRNQFGILFADPFDA